jgi:hypothetical protein
MAKNKKQHFISRSYLAAWCDVSAPVDRTPYVWVVDKDGTNPRNKAPHNIFYETDMYTIVKADGERDLVLEHGLSQLEDDFARLRNSKLNKHLPLTGSDRVVICTFMAAMHARTKVNREQVRRTWERPFKMMEHVRQRLKTTTPEQQRQMVAIPHVSESADRTLSYAEVKAIVEYPLQTMLVPSITATVPLLYDLDLAVLTTTDSIGFVTSDNPCVWCDPEAYKRPPMLRAPALAYDSIEITLPVSPKQCILLNRQGFNGYKSISPDVANKRTAVFAGESIVVRKKATRDLWFEPGPEPNDSWEKTHPEKAEEQKGEIPTT